MNSYPEYILVEGKKYKINTDYKIALKCEEIFKDDDICDYEKTLAIIYLLLGEEGLSDFNNHEKIVKLLERYLICDKNNQDVDDEEPSMDYKQDMGYIKASFMSDYNGLDIEKTNLSWWQFHDLLVGLTDNSILSRVRAIREESLSGKKGKERVRWEKLKKQVELKQEKTSYEKEMDKYWEEQMKLR